MKHMIVAVVMLSLSLSGCDDASISKAKTAAAHDLKDPASSQFREIHRLTRTTSNGGSIDVVCGEVNSKNGYGAYGGYTPFYFVLSHLTKGPLPDGAHAIATEGHIEVATDDASSQARVKRLCNSKDSLPLASGEYDYSWEDPCGGADGGDTSVSMARYLASKKFGKELTCETEKFSTETTPNFYTRSASDREAYLAKLKTYLPVANFLSEQGKSEQATQDARAAQDKKRASYAPPP